MIYGIQLRRSFLPPQKKKRARLHAPWRTRTWAPATKSRWSIRRPRLERAWLFSAKSGGSQNEGASIVCSTTKISHQTSMVWLHQLHLHASDNQPPLHPRFRCLSQLRKLNKFQSHFAFQASRPMGGTAQHGLKVAHHPTLPGLSVPGSREGVAIGYHSTCSLEAKRKKRRLLRDFLNIWQCWKKQLKFPSSLVSP